MLGANDKMNQLATILLYVYRAKTNEKNYDEKVILELIELIKSKNDDINGIKEIIKKIIKTDMNKASLMDLVTLSMPEESLVTKKLLNLIEQDLTESDLNKYLNTTSTLINESSKVLKNDSEISKSGFTLNTKDLSIEERKEIHRQLKEVLEKNLDDSDYVSNEESDMESISIEDDGVLLNLNKKNTGDSISLKVGWSEFSKAIGGEFITGELVDIEALSHKNKTGFTMSLFLQLILLNKITLKDGRKPMFLWISLEDDLSQVIIKMFVYLYFRKHKKMPLLLDISNEQINTFFKEEINATGNRLDLRRIDPDKFTIDRYKAMVRTYERMGFRVIATAVDYLEKAYTDGSKYNTGAVGSGLKNMVTKFRTFIQEKSILFFTPWQISTDANTLLRGGATDKEFLHMIQGKNYTQGTRGLMQELDVQILIHLCKLNGISYQAVLVGKLKRPNYVEAKDKFMLIPFEKNIMVGDKWLMGPLMEDCSASNLILKDDVDSDDLDL
jgi:hypothetical protein